MNSYSKLICFILNIIYFSFSLSAKTINKEYKDEIINRRTFGFSIQQGIPFGPLRTLIQDHVLNYKLPEGKSYKATGIIAVYHQPLFKTKRSVNLGVDIMPQVWFSKAHVASNKFGLQATVNLNIQIKKKNILSFHVGSGFHYFGMETKQQATGFIFSDNVLISFKRQVEIKNNKLTEFGFITGYRHLSNLGIKYPNHGINNIIVGFCFDVIH